MQSFIAQKHFNDSKKQSNFNAHDSDNELKFLQKTAYYINTVIVIIGIIHNAISSIVFLQKKLRKRKFNWYLQATSIIELIFCFVLLVDYLFSFTYSKPIFLHSLNKLSRIIIDFIIHTSDSCVAILTLFLSLDRLYAIKHPLLIKEFFTNLHAKSIIIISLSFLFLLKALNMFLCEIEIEMNEAHIVYCAFLSPLIFNTTPLIIIFIINSLLIYEIIHYYQKSQKKISLQSNPNARHPSVSLRVEVTDLNKKKTSVSIRKISNNQKKLSTFQKSHYLVILISALWSVFTSIPYYTFKSYFLLSELDCFKNIFYAHTIFKTQIVSSVLFNSNHSINFFIYICFHDEFRDCIKSCMCCCCKKGKSLQSQAKSNAEELIRKNAKELIVLKKSV